VVNGVSFSNKPGIFESCRSTLRPVVFVSEYSGVVSNFSYEGLKGVPLFWAGRGCLSREHLRHSGLDKESRLDSRTGYWLLPEITEEHE